MKHSIAVVINYCTNDYQFLRPNINQVKKFSQQIIIPICDHFYDGSLENQPLLARSIKANPEVNFISFKYNPRTTHNLWRGWQFILRNLGLGSVWGPQYWICFARQLGFKAIKQPVDYVLFLDADEIIDARKFLQWLNINHYKKFNALKPTNYWYWRSPRYQATVWEDSPLLVKYSCLKNAVFMDHCERQAIYKSIKGLKKD
jgi:predicted glycosyltransferase involved in capsule biosynthesis